MEIIMYIIYNNDLAHVIESRSEINLQIGLQMGVTLILSAIIVTQ